MVLVIHSINSDDAIRAGIFDDSGVTILSTSDFIATNLKSYKGCPLNILKQFELDLPRSKIYVDKVLINNISEFMNYFRFLKDRTINDISYDIMFAMICNQSTYATPYIFLSKAVFQGKMLLSDDANRSMRFDFNESNMVIDITGQFKVYDSAKDEHTGTVVFNMMINANIIKNKYWLYFLYEPYLISDNILNDNIVLSWSFQPQNPDS